MPSTKNIITSVALALAGTQVVTAVPLSERGLQACDPDAKECHEGQACLSGESTVNGGFGMTAFFCQDADLASKRSLTPCSPEGDECGSGEVCLSGDSTVSGAGSFGITAFYCQSVSNDDDQIDDKSNTPQKRFRPYLCPESGSCPKGLVCKNKMVEDPTTGSNIGPLDVCTSPDDAASAEKRFTPYLCPENGCPDDMVCKNKKVRDPTTGTMIGPLDVCVSA